MVHAAPSRDALVDLLWQRYHAMADEAMSSAAAVAGEEKRSMDGVLSLFVANCIVRWVDQLDQEPDEGRRQEMVNLLLADEGQPNDDPASPWTS